MSKTPTTPKTRTLPKGMYTEHEVYTLTVNPKHQYNVKASDIKYRPEYCTRDVLKNIVKHVKPYAKILMVPEISKGSGRWHYHGILEVRDVFGFMAYALPILNNLSVFEIDVRNDKDVWKRYMFKDRAVMEKGMTELGLPYFLENETSLPGKVEVRKHDAGADTYSFGMV